MLTRLEIALGLSPLPCSGGHERGTDMLANPGKQLAREKSTKEAMNMQEFTV